VWQGFKNKSRYVFAIIQKEQNELVGEISLHLDNRNNAAELGYWIGEPFWGMGIATEAAGAILKFGFEKLLLQLVVATFHEENPASGKVLLHNGMLKGRVNGNVALYSLTREEYEKRNAATF
jgi:[ribosomal protein S5]-alanine N-acetyltransferase